MSANFERGHVWYVLSHPDSFSNSQKTCELLNMNLASVRTVDKSDALQFALGQSHLGKRSIVSILED